MAKKKTIVDFAEKTIKDFRKMEFNKFADAEKTQIYVVVALGKEVKGGTKVDAVICGNASNRFVDEIIHGQIKESMELMGAFEKAKKRIII